MDNHFSSNDNNQLDDKTCIAGKQIRKTKTETDLTGKLIKERYLIEEKIGSGGMSDVYRARDTYIEKAGVKDSLVAIKVLQSEISDLSDATKLLISEAKKTQQLSHKNIIRVYDVDSDFGCHYIVMEWLDGESLDLIIKRSRPMGLSFKGAKKIINQIIDALSYAHGCGIIHTDLKPSNIMLTRQGEIKIFDFGVAQALKLHDDIYAVQNDDSETSVAGFTPAYASFEQLNNENTCQQDDIYAVSCIIYELLSSKHPYNRVAANEIAPTPASIAKPKNISYFHWQSLKKGLAIMKKDRAQDINFLKVQFNKNLTPLLTGLAASLCITAFVSYSFLELNSTIDKLQHSLDNSEAKLFEYESLSQQSTTELLAHLGSFTADQHILKEGLLRQHQQRIIDLYEQRIEAIPKGRNGKYKNYDEIISELKKALIMFPDSMRLGHLLNAQNTSKQSVIDALSNHLELLLSQSRYDEADNNSIENLINDLAFVDKTYKFLPSMESYQVYLNNFNQAQSEHDIQKINTLIQAGELAFIELDEAKPVLEKGNLLKKAVGVLNSYHRKLATNPNAKFPYPEAEVFYAKTFEEFETLLASVPDHNKLQELDQEVYKITSTLPSNFKPSVNIKKRLAASYLDYANQLMEKRRFLEAQKLVKKGNELYDQVDSYSLL